MSFVNFFMNTYQLTSTTDILHYLVIVYCITK